ncbi:MAG: glycosyltransferase family 4 protein [Rikenellaceae bacterium]|nr:glycosyltransferase family 4 protein [Rikenellaceae bacterium]
MKILIVHNRYSRAGGEEGVVAFQRKLLESRGHTVIMYERSYDEIRNWRFGRLASLFSALYNRKSVREIRELVQKERPDVAIVHNLFPVISPAVLPVLKKAGVRVLMTLHNYRLVCPTGIFYTGGRICERCGRCAGREWNCLTHKCEGSWAGNFGYALRGWWSRVRGYYSRNVDRFLALSDFQRNILSRYTGIPAERFAVVPNCIDPAAMPEPNGSGIDRGRRYVAYAGRLSREKGIDLLFETARMLPQVEFRVAGTAAEGYVLPEVPENVRLLGQLDKSGLADLYAGALAAVVTSRWYEGFPLSVIEAMYYAAPAVVPELGGLPEIVADGDAGLTYPAGSAATLAERIASLAGDPQKAAMLGLKGRQLVLDRYNPDFYYRLLVENAG